MDGVNPSIADIEVALSHRNLFVAQVAVEGSVKH
jgi:hypothetical protein